MFCISFRKEKIVVIAAFYGRLTPTLFPPLPPYQLCPCRSIPLINGDSIRIKQVRVAGLGGRCAEKEIWSIPYIWIAIAGRCFDS
jgi:hypothetical protein